MKAVFVQCIKLILVLCLVFFCPFKEAVAEGQSHDIAVDLSEGLVLPLKPTEQTAVVDLWFEAKPILNKGDMVTIHSQLLNDSNCENVIYQWQCDRGSGFEDIQGATQSTYSFELTDSSIHWNWKLIVKYR